MLRVSNEILTHFSAGSSYYTVGTAPSWSSSQLGPIAGTAPKQLSSNSPINSLSALSGAAVFASGPNGTYAFYSFDEAAQELSGIAEGELLSCNDCKSVAVNVGVCHPSPSYS